MEEAEEEEGKEEEVEGMVNEEEGSGRRRKGKKGGKEGEGKEGEEKGKEVPSPTAELQRYVYASDSVPPSLYPSFPPSLLLPI